MTTRVRTATSWGGRTAVVLAATSLIIFGVIAGAASRDVPPVDEVVSRAREAVFGSTGQPGDSAIELRGPVRAFDMDMQGVIVFDDQGRFRTEFAGPFVQIMGHDGTHTWEQSPDGNVKRLQDGNANFQRLFNWFLTRLRRFVVVFDIEGERTAFLAHE